MRSNRSFDTDTQRHCAARRMLQRTARGAMPLRVRVERPVRWPVPHSSFASKGRNKAMTRALPAYRRFKAARRLSVPEQ